MCVGTAARVIDIEEDTALIDVSGARRKVSAALLDELLPGDYVMVHAGAAIAKITASDEDEADELLGDLL